MDCWHFNLPLFKNRFVTEGVTQCSYCSQSAGDDVFGPEVPKSLDSMRCKFSKRPSPNWTAWWRKSWKRCISGKPQHTRQHMKEVCLRCFPKAGDIWNSACPFKISMWSDDMTWHDMTCTCHLCFLMFSQLFDRLFLEEPVFATKTITVGALQWVLSSWKRDVPVELGTKSQSTKNTASSETSRDYETSTTTQTCTHTYYIIYIYHIYIYIRSHV